MIGSELDELITNKEWTLNDILNMDETVDDLVQDLIDKMDIQTKYDIVKNLCVSVKGVKYDIPVKEIISDVLRERLSEIVSVTINEYLKTATVNLSKKKPEITEVVNEEKVDKPKEDKIVSLKEQIKKDVKQLDNKEMKEKGMI
tara:strand:+ start:215 stop:646 length:432 start_codon:yes stop_codon:yes gene_type:complete